MLDQTFQRRFDGKYCSTTVTLLENKIKFLSFRENKELKLPANHFCSQKKIYTHLFLYERRPTTGMAFVSIHCIKQRALQNPQTVINSKTGTLCWEHESNFYQLLHEPENHVRQNDYEKKKCDSPVNFSYSPLGMDIC